MSARSFLEFSQDTWLQVCCATERREWHIPLFFGSLECHRKRWSILNDDPPFDRPLERTHTSSCAFLHESSFDRHDPLDRRVPKFAWEEDGIIFGWANCHSVENNHEHVLLRNRRDNTRLDLAPISLTELIEVASLRRTCRRTYIAHSWHPRE